MTTDAAPRLTEKQFQRQVEQLAHTLGWSVYHTWNSMRSVAGFPDLLMLRGPRCVVAELKVGGKQPTPAQQAWLAAFCAAGIETYLWQESDMDGIVGLLR